VLLGKSPGFISAVDTIKEGCRMDLLNVAEPRGKTRVLLLRKNSLPKT